MNDEHLLVFLLLVHYKRNVEMQETDFNLTVGKRGCWNIDRIRLNNDISTV